MIRTAFMLYNGALVNVASKKSIKYIREAPSKNWGLEVWKLPKIIVLSIKIFTSLAKLIA
jgi:hypothetical protein